MKYLSKNEEEKISKYISRTILIAKKATCRRAKCGAIIVNSSKIIGEGFNSPPGNIEAQRRCHFSKNDYNKKVTDKTCCIHAEQRAIMDALKRNPEEIEGARLYFIRLDSENKPSKAGKPYCTICSKMALDVGIKEFVLWHDKGFCVYSTKEYNKLSFEFKNNK